jgi:uncharacterized protein (TIGR02453 family)
MPFAGFPPEGRKFLSALSRNNRREWFQPRKEIFETKVKAPMTELVEGINAALVGFAPDYITDPKRAIHRIYRDTRFSADKTPYKTHIAAMFPRLGGERLTSAGFYFHIAPKEVVVAMGLYMPGPEELFAVRSWLAENHTKFQAAVKKLSKVMGGLQGDSLTRSPKGFDPEHPAAGLIRKKAWFFDADLEPAIAESPQLLKEIVRRFRASAPVIEMLNSALARKAVPARPLQAQARFSE